MQMALHASYGPLMRCRHDVNHAASIGRPAGILRCALRKASSLHTAAGAAASRSGSLIVSAKAGDDDIQIGTELLAGRADARASMKWREATVVENK